jgi:FKBP-type peptidyl-prolyl cis-trans isomerase SlyD
MSEDVVRNGKYVGLSYTIVDPNGTVVEQHDLPIGYVYGSDTQLIGNMDKAIVGHKAGDEVQLTISPEEGFGERDESLTFTDDIDNVPEEFRRIGAEVQMQNDRGESRTFYVTRIEDGKLTVDGNHPLAGKELLITVKIHEVRDAQPGEDRTSGVHAINMSGPASIN